ncbi:MAG: glycoside hydrolase family 88 protein [Saprospiraceae bacterium]|nr:glycoside hydrolase family 88 protein [Saprospiraceae bacterium]
MQIRFFLLTCFFFGWSFAEAQRAEDFYTLTDDGAWCWFSDPRAVYHKDAQEHTFTGFVTSSGDIVVSSENHQTGEKKSNVLYQGLEVDDHVNPSILMLPDNRLMVFFTKHGGTIYYTTSKAAEDISSFETVDSLELGPMLCYTNPVLLSEENNRIYLFYRGGHDWKPTFITSDDLGRSWSAPKSFVSKKINNRFNRPYTKVVSDGKANIHFAFTDGHPREENHNSIYYLRYNKGVFYDIEGNKLGDTTQLPIIQETIPKVFDGQANNQRAWIWDVALDKEHNPVMVYSTLPEETQHFYYYGTWDGKKWQNKRLCEAGSAFPRFDRPKEMRDPEPHYSGGIALDHTNPRKVYLSRPHNDKFEIEEWITKDGGKTFEHQPITSASLHDNVRPFVVRNAPESLSNRVLWMHIDDYEHYTNYHTRIKGNQLAKRFDGAITSDNIQTVMGAVADWQIDNFHLVKHHPLDWTNGALYAGMMAWSGIASDSKYTDWLYGIGSRFAWQPFFRMYHADDIVVGQMYLEMYQRKTAEKYPYRILAPTKARLDYVVEHPSKGTLLLDYGDPQTLERWSWCDALFMAPPVYVKMANITGDDKYLKFMDKEFKATYDFLYDQEEHLFYRDYRFFPDKKREANGEKIFWGRGNGWVMGGLVSILKDLPTDSPYRPFYEELFVEMAEKVAQCQGTSGFWHASMLDHESFPNPETSCTGFYCYALTYGVNSGLLDRSKFEPIVTKAWKALVSAVYADGKLGWVQPIGEDPKNVTAQMTEVYGVGAFLLAGSEMIKLAK